MTSDTTIAGVPGSDADEPLVEGWSGAPVGRVGDRVFLGLSRGAGVAILVTLASVTAFLVWQAVPALIAPSNEVGPGGNEGNGKGFLAYVGTLVFGTVWAALLALLIAVPFGVAVALYISHYAPRRLARSLGYVIDLLAAIPSVVYGLWGIFVLAPLVADNVYPWFNDRLGFVPFFSGDVLASGRSMATIGIVLAVMILPIITAISREVFLQTPRLNEEAALALGATRWEMIRVAVLPYGKSGVISGAMLGLGRALGETMAVALILAPANVYSFQLFTSQNPNTIAANIALQFPESTGLEVNTLVATGLVLFVITLVVNVMSRRIARRRVA
ncbi:MAG TPA: phosphate ABC transporter permease subunit PstC [Ilumatobacter sp.]